MSLVKRAWQGSEMYCLCCEARSTLYTCLSYISRSSRQAMGLNLLINLYGPIDLSLNFVRSSTLLYIWLMKLQEKPYHLPETPGIFFFYQDSFSIDSNGLFSRVFWCLSPHWVLKKIFMTQKIIWSPMSVTFYIDVSCEFLCYYFHNVDR